MGFTRRFPSPQPAQVYSAIEGIVIIDSTPPGPVQGVGTGVVAIVGEFADCSLGIAFDPLTGKFATSPQPSLVFSSQDLIGRFGGFDETIGNFGGDLGNGFAALRNKQFASLVAVPVNIASQYGMRAYRDLPTNQSATSPFPVVPVSAATLPAGTEFKSGSHRVRTAAAAAFAGGQQLDQGIDGVVVAAGSPAAHQTFTSAGAHFQDKAKVGDTIALGVIGAAGAQGANAATYRIEAITSQTIVELELMTGTNFDWTSGTDLAWRLHPAAQADTGVGSILAVADTQYTIAARPLDATIAASTALTPKTIPAAATATTWGPLSGLGAESTSNAAGIVYTAAVQAPNAASDATLDALYAAAMDALLADSDPARSVNVLWCARKSAAIRTSMRTHVDQKAAFGIACIAVMSPSLGTVALNSVIGAADPGAGGNRDERVIYNWPGNRTSVPEAVGFALTGADGSIVTDGTLDETSDGWAAVSMSVLPPENNPAQIADPIPALLAPILGFQRGAVPRLGLAEYIALKANGVMALKNERNVGFIFQSGVTTSLASGEDQINRRRFADFIEDSLADSTQRYAKLPITEQWKADVLGIHHAFMDGLLSVNNPSAQRIVAYSIDAKSGNTPQLEAQNIFIEIIRVQMVPLGNTIVLQVAVGPGVNVQG